MSHREIKEKGFCDSKQLVIARKYLNLKQSDVAEEVSIGLSNYANIENGKSDPKWSNLKKIIEFYKGRGIEFYNDGNVEFVKKNTK